jgi:NDMA-dependent alcohol dehydrogenase
MTEAAVLQEVDGPLRLVEVELEPPHAGEVEVEIAATGVCHSDVSVLSQRLPHPLPVVLGHEGAGIITAVGDGVHDVAVGDRVVLSWLAQCGDCFYCVAGQPQLCEKAGVAFARGTLMDGSTRFSLGGRPMYQMAGLGTFARRCVVPARSAIKIPDSIPFTSAALIGCGVLTGWGAAVNTASVGVGESVAVVGCGGVGLNAVQGARLAGAGTIVAIDLHDERLEMAQSLGATHVMRPGDGTVRRVRDLLGGRGVDVALDVVGRPESIRDAVSMTRRGGRVVLVGAAGDEVQLSIPAFTGIVMTEKMIRGSLYGSTNVRRDVPRLVQLYEAGRLKLDELVTAVFPFHEVNEAVDYCRLEKGARAVIAF